MRLPVPGQELADAVDRMIGDASDHVGEPGFWLNTVHLGRFYERLDKRGAPSAFIGASEKIILSAKRNRADCALGGVVCHFQVAVVDISRQSLPA